MKNSIKKFDQEFDVLFEKYDEAVTDQENKFPGSTTLQIESTDESINKLMNICNEISESTNSEFIVFT
jgi:hypothetical protein